MAAYDLAVIGAGPGGYVAAIRAAQLGQRTVVVEREHLGGVCLNWGCIPTKAMLRSAEVYQLMRQAADFGLAAEGVGYDLGAVVRRSRAVARQLNAGVAHLLKKNGVEVRMGEARLAGPGRVAVGADELAAGAVIVATGARARELPGLEADGRRVWSYRHALEPPHMPARLLVVGSGAIGIEFASFFRTLGAEVWVVELEDRILPAEDEEVAALARKAFEKQGMAVWPGARVERLARREDGVTAHVVREGRPEALEVDTVIVAVGIAGNVEGLGLEALGVRVERGHVVVDAHCRTGVDGVYAIGDVAGPPWLAHKASHEGVMVAELVAGRNDVHPVRPEAIAGCTYCHPQVASVGLTEAKARASGREIRVGRFPFLGNGKAIALGDTEGLVKTVFDAATGELLGAHMIGAEVTELIHGYVVARALETTEAELIGAVFPHPTLAEAMHESVLDAWGRAIHY